MFRGAIIVEFSSVSVKYLPAANPVMLQLSYARFCKDTQCNVPKAIRLPRPSDLPRKASGPLSCNQHAQMIRIQLAQPYKHKQVEQRDNNCTHLTSRSSASSKHRMLATLPQR